MINNNRILGVIPARGGSKSVPRKNLRIFAGKPLIAWTIIASKKSRYIDRLILSSEDDEIINVAEKYELEVPFIRPEVLAIDSTSGLDVALHAVEMISGYDIIVFLQPTSPLRSCNDIDSTIKKLEESNADKCVSICETSKSPYWMFKLNKDNQIRPIVNNQKSLITIRQDLPKTYNINGAVYVARIAVFKETKTFIDNRTVGYTMPIERSIDIDSELDFIIAEKLYK